MTKAPSKRKSKTQTVEWSPCGRFWFDEKAANKVVRFFRKLKHVKGPLGGQPFALELWEEKFVRALFGWKRKEDGTRKYRVAYLEIGRGNGKSALSAGLALALLFIDDEPGPEVVSVAGTREQADHVYSPAAAMTRGCPMLNRRAKVLESPKRIAVPGTNGFYRPISADDRTGHGFNLHGLIFDEFHVQKDRHLWDTMTTSTGKRRQPLTIITTTSGSDRSTICWEMHQHALAVLENPDIDPSFLPVIFAADPADDWTDEKVWAKANPNLGVSVPVQYLREQCQRAKQNVAFESTFRRLHLCQWLEQDVRVIPMDQWRACADKSLIIEASKPVFGGLDLSSTMDVCAWVKVADLGDGRFAWKGRYWMPEGDSNDRARRDRRTAMNFAERGLITLTEGNELDYFRVVREVVEDCTAFNVQKIGFDPWNARMFIQAMKNSGVPHDKLVNMPQTFATYNEPFKRLLGALASRKFVHDGDPVFEWMASNVAAKTDASGNIRPDKEKSGDKIDGITAGLLGTALMIVAEPEKSNVSYYENFHLDVFDTKGWISGGPVTPPVVGFRDGHDPNRPERWRPM
jgi:phage terminase large subunit-like protein